MKCARTSKSTGSLGKGNYFFLKIPIVLILSGVMVWPTALLASQRVLLPSYVGWGDKTALQRGAVTFMAQCSGCHSLHYMRYQQVVQDLEFDSLTALTGWSESPNATQRIEASLPAEDAIQWFGRVPPDLSLITRTRGAPWLLAYLQGFYEDVHQPYGVNNTLLPGGTMPNVLAPLQDAGKGGLSPHEFEQLLEELTAFLVYVGEPAKLVRYTMGWRVLIFLSLFLILTYGLKNSYWRALPRRDAGAR